MPAADITHELQSVLQNFSSSFDTVYRPLHPFDSAECTTCSHQMLSNLLGGTGYFHGDSRVDRSNAPEYEETSMDFWKGAEKARKQHQSNVEPADPGELFSLVPSRSFFPRGLLWDEGFHLLVVLGWDLDLAVEILMSWFGRMVWDMYTFLSACS